MLGRIDAATADNFAVAQRFFLFVGFVGTMA
jgi:hypothetical protein